MPSPAEPADLLVVCLCAAWCGSCRDYAAPFARAAAGAGGRWGWIDIEEHADLLGDHDIKNFPTLLIAAPDAVLFFGPVTPHASTLQALVARAASGGLAPLADVAVLALAERARRLLAGPALDGIGGQPGGAGAG